VARLFRFVEKKRGRRWTGSNVVGNLSEAAFCGSLFVVGTLLLALIVGMQLVKPDPEVFTIGYGWLLLVLVGASSAVLGAGGLIWTVLNMGVSIERRSAFVRRAEETDFVHAAVPRPREFPGLPTLEGLIDSPGIELAYRLPPSETPGWRLLAITIFALLWNFVVCFLTVSVISGHIAGRHEWLLTALLIPFWIVCYWSVRSFLQLLMVQTGMGQTTLEISELPVAPGRDYEALLAQNGHVAMKSLQLWLVCEEEATFTQGTDIRTEVREVYRELCFERRDYRVEPVAPFTQMCRVHVPKAGMHSFQSAHNVIRWKLLIRGEAQRWPPFERGFPIVVYPGQATMQVNVSSLVARSALRPAMPLAAGVRA
jgi:hypothetical protein